MSHAPDDSESKFEETTPPPVPLTDHTPEKPEEPEESEVKDLTKPLEALHIHEATKEESLSSDPSSIEDQLKLTNPEEPAEEYKTEVKETVTEPKHVEEVSEVHETVHHEPIHHFTHDTLHHEHVSEHHTHVSEDLHKDSKANLKRIYNHLLDTDPIQATEFLPPFASKLRAEGKFHSTLLFTFMDFGGDFVNENTLEVNGRRIEIEKFNWSARCLQVGEGRLMFTGGKDSMQKAFILEVESGEMSDLPDLLEGRDLHAMTWINGYPAVIGGGDKSQAPLSTVEVLQLTHWKSMSSLQNPRYGHSSTYHDSKTFVVGGADGKNSPVTSIEIFETGIWRAINPPFDLKRVGCGLVALPNKLLILGGFSLEKTNTASVLSFDTSKETVSECKALDEPASFSQNLWRFTGGHIESHGFRGKKISYKPE